MLKNLIKKATWLAVAGVFAGAFVNAQPVVKVPITCNVVFGGTSTGPQMPVLGLGGYVGNGGIVCMPDPFDIAGAGGNFTIALNGATIVSWQLWGDISEQTATLAGTPDQSAGAVGVLNIESYNKVVRTPSENTAPVCSTLARSKGRVRINYTQAPCNNFIEFDILKQYSPSTPGNTVCGVGYPLNYLPQIIGPGCLLPLTTYTYSVDQIASDNAGDAIGFDQYYWSTLPAGYTNAYYSADRSSITFTTNGPSVTPFTLQCCYGRCNPWDGNIIPFGSHTTCVSKSLVAGPVAPTVVVPPCVNTGTVSTALSATGGFGTFTWGEFSPWSFSPTTGISTTLSYNGDNNPQQISVTASVAGCLPNVVTTYNVNRTYKSPFVSLTHSPAGTCLSATGTYTFTVGPNALNNATTWRFPAGLLGAGIVTQTTTSATNTVTFANAPAGQYIVRALSTACATDSIPDTICIKPAVPVITSPTCITRGTTPTSAISCNAVPGVSATGYTWTYPATWSCTACNTVNPTFTPNGTTALEYAILTVTAATTGGCACATTSINDTIWYNPVTPNSITASCWNTNGTATGTTVISVANAPNPFFGSYTISSVPAGLFTGYSVNAQGGIVLTGVNAVAGSNYTLTITHTTTHCGNSAAVPLVVTPANISGTMLSILTPGIGNNDIYYVNSPPAAPSYQWFVNGGATGGTGSSQTLSGNGSAPISVCVNITSSPIVLGTTSVCRKPQECCTGACVLGTHSLRHGNNGTGDNAIKGISIYPNPNDGNFTIVVPDFKVSATAILIDLDGKEVGNYPLQKGENKITSSSLAKGMYAVVLLIDDKADSRKIEIK